jgi:ferredoxin, 2Fe-2S
MIYKVNIISTSNKLIEIPFRRYEYPNLMELIVNTYYEEIGECLGRGLCGKCHLKIITGILQDTMDVTEKETLFNLNERDTNSRLACQIILDEKINNMTFKIITNDN